MGYALLAARYWFHVIGFTLLAEAFRICSTSRRGIITKSRSCMRGCGKVSLSPDRLIASFASLPLACSKSISITRS